MARCLPNDVIDKMDYGHHKKKVNIQVDRLSSLPNDLIHKIFSFIGLKHAVQTIALSSRYRFIWTSMPYLNFTTRDFNTLPKFSKFVTQVLSRRNTRIEVSCVKLDFHGKVSQGFVKKILDYAFSHNVKQMSVTYLPDKGVEFPLSLFSSQSLKHLTLSGHDSSFSNSSRYISNRSINIISTCDLPALTTLYLEYIDFKDVITENCIGLFSKCPNLKNLTLSHCSMGGSNSVDIRHPGISNLTLKNRCSKTVLNVVAPQLKNLIIRDWSGVHLLSAPNLVSLVLKGSRYLQYFSSNGLSSLEKADLCIYEGYINAKSNKEYARMIIGMLQQLHKAKFLTLNLEMIQLLSSSVELISHQPSPFKNLKSLKVYPCDTSSKVQETIPTEVKNYLLDSSLGATFTMVSCEEIIASRNTISAQKLMAELRVMLEQENANTETSVAHTDSMESEKNNMSKKRKAHPAEKMQLDIKSTMVQLKDCWKDVGVQIDQGEAKTSRIISKLRDIELLLFTLRKLPKSKRDKLQECFSCLRSEADTVVKKIVDRMKIHWDENQIRLGFCFRELATKSQSYDSSTLSVPIIVYARRNKHNKRNT